MKKELLTPILIAACILTFLCGLIWVGIGWQSIERDSKTTCIQQGGIYVNGTCMWSKKDQPE